MICAPYSSIGSSVAPPPLSALARLPSASVASAAPRFRLLPAAADGAGGASSNSSTSPSLSSPPPPLAEPSARPSGAAAGAAGRSPLSRKPSGASVESNSS
eukprot:366168-Chlamydomonas_euryale.AAC.4